MSRDITLQFNNVRIIPGKEGECLRQLQLWEHGTPNWSALWRAFVEILGAGIVSWVPHVVLDGQTVGSPCLESSYELEELLSLLTLFVEEGSEVLVHEDSGDYEYRYLYVGGEWQVLIPELRWIDTGRRLPLLEIEDEEGS